MKMGSPIIGYKMCAIDLELDNRTCQLIKQTLALLPQYSEDVGLQSVDLQRHLQLTAEYPTMDFVFEGWAKLDL